VSLLVEFAAASFDFAVMSAPSLLLGFLLAGLLHVFIPADRIPGLIGRPGLRSVFLASAIGLPLPLCSCGVIPVALGLRKKGASRGATAAFFISTPEIGIDSFLLSLSLLGLPLSIVRIIASFASAALVGVVIDLLKLDGEESHGECGAPAGCCETDVDHRHRGEIRGRLAEGIRYGFIDLVDDTAGLLFAGFLLAGLIAAALPGDALSALGPGAASSYLTAFVISLPMYVCASSSTPLAFALIEKGLSPGAALVFLLAGPASNVATMTAVKSRLGSKSLAVYLAGIAAVSLATGMLTDLFSLTVPAVRSAGLHEHSSGSFFLGVVLLGWLGWRFVKNFRLRSGRN
jgi:uncharacterized membrane protein YraQ (UPF0718 family)